MTKQKTTFEDDMMQLEKIVQSMEQGELPLEESLKVFEEGTKLIKRCQKRLAETELRVEKIMNAQGETEE